MTATRQYLISIFRRVVVRAWVFSLWLTGQLHQSKKRLTSSKVVLVLLLHRVLDKESANLSCTPREIVLQQQTFQRMLTYLASQFEIVDLSAATTLFPGVSSRPRVAVTFDDGWTDTYTTVFPAALAAGLKFSIFVCPQMVGKTCPFWPEKVVAGMRAKEPKVPQQRITTMIERLKVMPASERDRYIAALPSPQTPSHNVRDLDTTFGWSTAIEMEQAGVAFGSHTSTHQMLTRIPPTEARREVFESRGAIRTRLRQTCVLFAYPNGDVSPKVRDLVKDAGYHLAFTTKPGLWTEATDLLEIPRVTVSESQVTGFFGSFSTSMFDYSMIWKASRTL